MATNLIILGASRSGKDTIAKALGWQNLKFAKWAKDWVDVTFGGSFEEDRHRIIAPGKSKLDLMIELFHLLKEYNASVEFARNNWELPPKLDTCYTDVRRLEEFRLLAQYKPHVLYLPHGVPQESDAHLGAILYEAINLDLNVTYWVHGHPASYSPDELVDLLKEYGLTKQTN